MFWSTASMKEIMFRKCFGGTAFGAKSFSIGLKPKAHGFAIMVRFLLLIVRESGPPRGGNLTPGERNINFTKPTELFPKPLRGVSASRFLRSAWFWRAARSTLMVTERL